MSIKRRIEKLEQRAGGGEERPIVTRIRFLDHDGNEIPMPEHPGKSTPPMRLPDGKPNVRYIQVRRPTD